MAIPLRRSLENIERERWSVNLLSPGLCGSIGMAVQTFVVVCERTAKEGRELSRCRERLTQVPAACAIAFLSLPLYRPPPPSFAIHRLQCQDQPRQLIPSHSSSRPSRRPSRRTSGIRSRRSSYRCSSSRTSLCLSLRPTSRGEWSRIGLRARRLDWGVGLSWMETHFEWTGESRSTVRGLPADVATAFVGQYTMAARHGTCEARRS